MPHKNTVFRKLCFIFLLIIIPITFSALYILRLSDCRLQRKTLETADTATCNLAAQLDIAFESIYDANWALISQTDVRKLANLSRQIQPYERVMLSNQIREQMNSLRYANSLIHHIRLYLPDSDCIISSDGYSKGSFQVLDKEAYDLLLALSHTGAPVCCVDNTPTILLTPIQTHPAFLLEIAINSSAISSIFSDAVVYSEEYYMLDFPDSGYRLTNLPDSLLDSLNSDLLPTENGSKLTLNGEEYFSFFYALPFSNGRCLKLISCHSMISPLDVYSAFTNIIIFTVILCCLAFLFICYRLIHQPLTHLTDAFYQVENGGLEVQITEEKPAEFTYLYNGFNTMTKRLSQMIEKEYTQKMLLQKAELKQLQAQINPHFLYNSFFMLQRMIKSGLQDEAEEMSRQLGVYFRYITRNSMDMASLSQEYEHARIYASIQGLRFEGRIEVSFADLPAAFASMQVPKLILQPVIENAFNYGLENKMENGLLAVKNEPVPGGIRIAIEDNGDRLSDDALQKIQEDLSKAGQNIACAEMTGLLNIGRRIAILTCDPHAVTAKRSSLGGLCVEIVLKLVIPENGGKNESNPNC